MSPLHMPTTLLDLILQRADKTGLDVIDETVRAVSQLLSHQLGTSDDGEIVPDALFETGMFQYWEI